MAAIDTDITSNGDIVIGYKSNIQSVLNDGITQNNATVIARIDGETGKTIWAKQLNLNFTYSKDYYLIDIEISSNDSIWSVFTFRTLTDFRSSVILHDNEGNILNVYVFGMPDSGKEYVLYHLEVVMMKYITDQNIVFMAESQPNMEGFNVNEYSGTDVVMLSLNSNSSTNWITSFDLGQYREYTDSFEVDDRIYIAIKGSFDQF